MGHTLIACLKVLRRDTSSEVEDWFADCANTFPLRTMQHKEKANVNVLVYMNIDLLINRIGRMKIDYLHVNKIIVL